MIRIDVPLDSRSYPVVVGNSILSEFQSLVPPEVSRVAFVTQKGIDVSIPTELPSSIHYLPDGEQAKRLSVLEDLCGEFAREGLTRRDLVVGIGGGVVTDVAGFAASVYHRGVQVMHVPTTLLGQIDAAIGGKTGVNLEEGKIL